MPKIKSLKSNDARIVSDGVGRLAAGIADSVRADIQKEVEAQYAERLKGAGTIRRWWINMKMTREIDRRVAKVVEKNLPPSDTLYLTK